VNVTLRNGLKVLRCDSERHPPVETGIGVDGAVSIIDIDIDFRKLSWHRLLAGKQDSDVFLEMFGIRTGNMG
jgi:hypothetical protein